MGTLLQFERVSAVYGGSVSALTEISFRVEEGAFVALLGANGAGKSTTLKAASNLLPAERGRVTGGDILFAGDDVTRIDPARHIRAGLVPVLEGRRLFRALSIEENLVTGAIGRGFGHRRIAEGLDRVYDLFPRLKQRRRSVAGLTSGGEQQMAAIGRGLMAEPRLFVLDEPSMGLAPLVVAEIFDALSRLNREEGVTLLVAEQNSSVALRHADWAVVLETGRSSLSGRAADLIARADVQDSYFGGAVV
ncbi:ABC transporter ATP-binding protein [Paenirhodobacter enshiensis]|uniref:Branched-chain amino acid ABC transporter ATP-binding protein n=1 Tax=Paenirhodobacter enshiensis TaxID=1105367 RepID=A0A086XRJ1_9RHOB|nr:ABC transporter ATP-binding protein [Paenirhodobacter enshiensis]KFI24641.1 branched-chain amino acid ABC transporter ATP-binding protein [Paenirhodobacter enshiensis]